MKKITLSILVLIGFQSVFGQNASDYKDIVLSKWQLKSTVLEKNSGDKISMGKFSQDNWYQAQTPTTVLNTLVKNGVYPDPRLDVNAFQIPDVSDKYNKRHGLAKYSYLPNKENPWQKPYWFKTEFNIPESYNGKQVWLNFKGINYRAELWINGVMLADSSEMAGMFQRFRYNITKYVKKNASNYIAVKIFQVDHPGTPGIQNEVFGDQRGASRDLFKDVTMKITGGWDCGMPVGDRNMGIYQDVYLSFTDDVDILHPYIVTDLPLPDTTLANLTITANLQNTYGQARKGLLKGKIDLITEVDMCSYTKKMSGKMKTIYFEKEVEIPANYTMPVTVSYKDFPQLAVKNPYLWWPNGSGEQYLHNLQLEFVYDGKSSVTKNVMFGIREVGHTIKEIDGNYGLVYIINGRKIFCKGGWLQPDQLMNMSRKRMYDEARFLAAANLNLVGSEDMPATPDDFIEAFDKYGLMWWELFYQCAVMYPDADNAYYPIDHALAVENEQDIILRYRNSPSLVGWVGANETVPGPDLYYALKRDLKAMDQTRPFLPTTNVSWDVERQTPYMMEDMPMGVAITDYGAPGYTWRPSAYYFDKIEEIKLQMFRDELGMPAVPSVSTLRKMFFKLGEDKSLQYFPLDSVWAWHGAWDLNGYAFKAYYMAIKNLYGYNGTSVEDFARIGQYVHAEGYRAMFEAANARMWDITSGIMLWKLNSAAPDVLWQLYDWYLSPLSSLYFTRKACEPLHIQMNANSFQVSVINTYGKALKGLKVKARIVNFNMEEKWSREETIDMKENTYQEIFRIPQLSKITPVYFVRLELVDAKGNVVSENMYWQSSNKENPDFSSLSNAEYVKPEMKFKVDETKDEYLIKVTLKNTSKKLSFMNRAAVVKKGTKDEIHPTFWDDNYITLFPGEEKVINARVSKQDVDKAGFSLFVGNDI